MSRNFIEFSAISKDYGALRVVDGLDLDIAKGEFVSLLGPSGSGKTTLLMMLAGFEEATKGDIRLDGRRINDIPSHRRDMGVVFQNYALFPHMTIADNVGFPLQMRNLPKAEVRRKVAEALEMIRLDHLADRLPSQLSGGQQQRVALARALVFEPGVVLMDEPLGALDKQLREQMQLEIRALHRRLGLTIIFVTHDQDEALTMSDRIAVFDRGRIQQCAPPREVYDRPANRFVAEFIGETNMIEARVMTRRGQACGLRLPDGIEFHARTDSMLGLGDDALLSLRPERITLHPRGTDTANHLDARVTDIVYQGDHLRVSLETAIGPLTARLDRREAERGIGDEVTLGFSPDDAWVIAP